MFTIICFFFFLQSILCKPGLSEDLPACMSKFIAYPGHSSCSLTLGDQHFICDTQKNVTGIVLFTEMSLTLCAMITSVMIHLYMYLCSSALIVLLILLLLYLSLQTGRWTATLLILMHPMCKGKTMNLVEKGNYRLLMDMEGFFLPTALSQM